jgi:hypothetical protein
MRYDITKEKIQSLIDKVAESNNINDLNLLKGYTKVALIDNKKVRQAHKLDEIYNLPVSEQYNKCVEYAEKVFEGLVSDRLKNFSSED